MSKSWSTRRDAIVEIRWGFALMMRCRIRFLAVGLSGSLSPGALAAEHAIEENPGLEKVASEHAVPMNSPPVTPVPLNTPPITPVPPKPAASGTPNHPPRFIRAQPYMDAASAVRIRPGVTLRIPVLASDADGDAIVYGTKALPTGAQFDAENQSFVWTPQVEDAGLHSVIFTASDGALRDSLLVQFQVVSKPSESMETPQEVGGDASNVESFLQPGVGYGLYVPGDHDSLGVFQGVNLELNIISWIHKNDDRGPSHGRFYLKAEILPSTKNEVSQLFVYSLGTTLTFERNPKRSWLLPFYGVEFGGLNQEEIGGAFQSSFFAGLHFWASANLFVNLSAGYMLVPEQMKELGGFHGGTTIDFSLW